MPTTSWHVFTFLIGEKIVRSCLVKYNFPGLIFFRSHLHCICANLFCTFFATHICNPVSLYRRKKYVKTFISIPGLQRYTFLVLISYTYRSEHTVGRLFIKSVDQFVLYRTFQTYIFYGQWSVPQPSPPSSQRSGLPVGRVGRRDYWMVYRGPGFLSVVWFGSSPTSPLSRQKARPATHRKTDKKRQCADKEGGEAPNHTNAKKPGSL
jgi:hypothetical protein